MNISALLIYIVHCIYLTNGQNISMRAWVDPGYYYSHRCQVNVQVISTYFQSFYQLFHVFARQNANFFHTQEYYNVFYVKGTNSMQIQMSPSEKNCKFPMSTTYFCPFISVQGYDPYGIDYYQVVNQTHRKLTFRINRVICPQQSTRMSFRIQMPSSSDYSFFYMFYPTIMDQQGSKVDKLTFVYDKQVEVDISALKYKQVQQISFLQATNFLLNCKFIYTLGLRFSNLTYYDSWQQISIFLTNPQSVLLSTQCQSTLNKSHSCIRTSYGYKLVNNFPTDMIKSYEIAEHEYFANDPISFGIAFAGQFISSGEIQIEVVCRASNMIRENWLNMTHNQGEVYGRKTNTIYGYSEEEFAKITAFSTKYDTLKCIIPMVVNNLDNNSKTENSMTNNNSTTNNSKTDNKTDTTTTTNTTITTNTTTNTTTDSSGSTFSFQNDTNGSSSNFSTNFTDSNAFDSNFTFVTSTDQQLNQLIFIASIIAGISATLCLRQYIQIYEKIVYLVTIFILQLFKLLFLTIGVNQKWLISSDAEINSSIIRQSFASYSLQLFILKSTFILQIILNGIYFLTYLIMIIFSKQITQRINQFYGKRIKTLQGKLNKCNLSSFIFGMVTFLTFLLSFKIYSFLVFKLHLNLDISNQQQFKKYRFKNSVIYKIHPGHIGIDILFQINACVWLFILANNCENQIFTYFLYFFLSLYCIHTFLMALTLKSFYVMAKKSDQYNETENDRFKIKSDLLQPNIEIQKTHDQNYDQINKPHQQNQQKGENRNNRNKWSDDLMV